MSKSVKYGSGVKNSAEYNEKIRRAGKWLGENHSIGYDSSLQYLDQIFDESQKVSELLSDFKSLGHNPADDIAQKILKIDIDCHMVKLKELLFGKGTSENTISISKDSLKELCDPLGDTIHEFYTLTLKAHNITPEDEAIKRKWRREL